MPLLNEAESAPFRLSKLYICCIAKARNAQAHNRYAGKRDTREMTPRFSSALHPLSPEGPGRDRTDSA